MSNGTQTSTRKTSDLVSLQVFFTTNHQEQEESKNV